MSLFISLTVLIMAAFVAASLNPFNYFGGVKFRPETDIPDLSDKVILVTGGTYIP